MTTEDWIADEVRNALEGSWWAVSGSAFQRNGKILDTETCTLNFDINIEVTNATIKTHKTPYADCEICQGDPPRRLGEAVLNDPITSDGTYERYSDTSHQAFDCQVCNSIGSIQCPRCNGNGRERCESCKGERQITDQQDCQECGGTGGETTDCRRCGSTGTIEVRIRCPTCEGNGHVICGACEGDGTVTCDRCEGSGEVHEYESTIFEVTYDLDVSGFPSTWESSPLALAKKFSFQSEHLASQEITIEWAALSTKPIECTCVNMEYGADQYNLLLVHTLVDRNYVWDPETRWPRTSVRRKLGDIKSRLLW